MSVLNTQTHIYEFVFFYVHGLLEIKLRAFKI
jgi:hypothetical protein